MILKDFYTVSKTETSDSKHITSLKINKEHEIYNGHFPGRPVTPGVVLMLLFKEEVQRLSGKTLQLVRANNVKFTAVFDPTDNNELILESEIEETGEFINLKGIAKKEEGIVLKINSLYQII